MMNLMCRVASLRSAQVARVIGIRLISQNFRVVGLWLLGRVISIQVGMDMVVYLTVRVKHQATNLGSILLHQAISDISQWRLSVRVDLSLPGKMQTKMEALPVFMLSSSVRPATL